MDLHITHLVNHADAETFLIIRQQENVSTPVMVLIWPGKIQCTDHTGPILYELAEADPSNVSPLPSEPQVLCSLALQIRKLYMYTVHDQFTHTFGNGT